MDCVGENIIIDSILSTYKADLGKYFYAYRNHVYRALNVAMMEVTDADDIQKLTVAVAFHDLGLWTHHSFDYLSPSIQLAKNYCLINGIGHSAAGEIEAMISDHHQLSPINHAWLAKVFRRADMADLTFGWIYKGKNKKQLRIIRKTFPNAGFHLYLCKMFIKNLLINPLKPLPMFKF